MSAKTQVWYRPNQYGIAEGYTVIIMHIRPTTDIYHCRLSDIRGLVTMEMTNRELRIVAIPYNYLNIIGPASMTT